MTNSLFDFAGRHQSGWRQSTKQKLIFFLTDPKGFFLKLSNLLMIGTFVFMSCDQAPPTPTTPSAPKTRTEPKVPDIEKRRQKCEMGKGDLCSDDKDCQEICDDIFSTNKLEEQCEELPQTTVEKIDELFAILEDEDEEELEDIDQDILECLLDIDETEFADAVEDFNRSTAQAFALQIMDDDNLARIFKSEDDEAIVLKALLKSATKSSDFSASLIREIDDDKGFLQLAAEGEERAWEWLDNYVGDICDKESSKDCPGDQKSGFYCSVLLNDRFEDDLPDFLSSADHFEDEYRSEVEGDGYNYQVHANEPGKTQDFRIWCLVQQGESLPCPCPDYDNTSNSREGCTLGSNNKVARIDFDGFGGGGGRGGGGGGTGRGDYNYLVAGGLCRGDARSDYRQAYGSADPSSQRVILEFSDTDRSGSSSDKKRGVLILNNDKVKYNSDKTYYLYIYKVANRRQRLDDEPKNQRYTLTAENKQRDYTEGANTCSTTDSPREIVWWKDFITHEPYTEHFDTDSNHDNDNSDTDGFDIYLAVEDTLYGAKTCTFITPE